MTKAEAARRRLDALSISRPRAKDAAGVVTSVCALQGQDYAGALWAIGLRLPGSTREDIEKAIGDRAIVRSWPIRGTLHFVSSRDIGWLLGLLAERSISASLGRYRQLRLSEDDFARSEEIVRETLGREKLLGRRELLRSIESGGVSTAGQRGAHIVRHLSLTRVIVFGPHVGKQPAFVLYDEWIPDAEETPAEPALARLAGRYFSGHGPALLDDFVNWSGLTRTDAKRAVELAAGDLVRESIEGLEYWSAASAAEATEPSSRRAYLLPGFDEYMLGYRDRSAALGPGEFDRICPGGNGMFRPTIVVDGQVIGTWRPVSTRKRTLVEATTFRSIRRAEKSLVEAAADRYAKFTGLPAELVWQGV